MNRNEYTERLDLSEVTRATVRKTMTKDHFEILDRFPMFFEKFSRLTVNRLIQQKPYTRLSESSQLEWSEENPIGGLIMYSNTQIESRERKPKIIQYERRMQTISESLPLQSFIVSQGEWK